MVAVVAAFLYGIFSLIYMEAEQARSVKQQCLERGYPDYQAIGPLPGRRYFCQRRVNATDELMEVRP